MRLWTSMEDEKLQWKLIKQKLCSYHLGRKVVFRRWFFLVFVVSRLVIILLNVGIVRVGSSSLF